MAVQPDVGKAGAGPGGGDVFAKFVRRAAGLLDEDRRAFVAVAELGADHFVGFTLLDFGDPDELVQVRPQAAPLAPALRGVGRGGDVAAADLAALDLVGGEELRPAPALEGAGGLPGEADGVADAAVHAEAAGGDDEAHP